MACNVIVLLSGYVLLLFVARTNGQCTKLDSCSCHDEATGKNISLHELASHTGGAAFNLTSGRYLIEFNPCTPFTDHNGTQCSSVAFCQTDTEGDQPRYYNLGTQSSAAFIGNGSRYSIVYEGSPTFSGQNRITTLDLVCDAQAENAKLVYAGELTPAHYLFNLTSKCACPGGCDTRSTCTQEGCGCRLNSGQLINIQTLNTPKTPISALGFGITATFNPCTGFTEGNSPEGGCKDTTSCVYRDGQYYDYGIPATSSYDVADGVVSLNYRSADGGRQTSVNLVCDESKRHYATLAILEQPTESQLKMELRSVCACPGRCIPPVVTCTGTDTCSCTLSDGSGRISLHNLDNPFAPIIEQIPGIGSIFYNPCSNFTARPPHDKRCKDVALCAETQVFGDGSLGLQIGVQYSVLNDKTPPEIALTYTGGMDGITSIVILECDETALVPKLVGHGVDPQRRHVTFGLVSKDACIVREAPHMENRL